MAIEERITLPTLNGIKLNEEYTQLAPSLSEREYESLKESIKSNGLHYAIVINKDNVLLDGHHRYRACKELNIQPKIQVKEFADELEEKKFVIEMATHRRHLNPYQKVELGIKLEEVKTEIAKLNVAATIPKKGQKGFQPLPVSGSNEPPIGPVAINIASGLGLSATTYKRAKYIHEHGTEQQKQRLRENNAKINTEYIFLMNNKKRSHLIAESKSSKVLDDFFKDNGRMKLLLGDMREKSKQIPDNSIDLIFTDPPYATKDLPLYADLAKLAIRVLKPGGSLITYAGHYSLPQVFDYLLSEPRKEDQYLKYIHQIIVEHSGPRETLFAYNIGVKYKPLLWFVKGAQSPNATYGFIEDIIMSEPVAKTYHKWEQSPVEAEYMISKLTGDESQTVLDPFLGGGTTAVAAIKLNRRFIGIELDEDTFHIAKGRVARFASEGYLTDDKIN